MANSEKFQDVNSFHERFSKIKKMITCKESKQKIECEDERSTIKLRDDQMMTKRRHV